jgi:hypothetical protein
MPCGLVSSRNTEYSFRAHQAQQGAEEPGERTRHAESNVEPERGRPGISSRRISRRAVDFRRYDSPIGLDSSRLGHPKASRLQRFKRERTMRFEGRRWTGGRDADVGKHVVRVGDALNFVRSDEIQPALPG